MASSLSKSRPTLAQVFALSLLGLGAVLLGLFVLVFHSSQTSLIESSERLRDQASREIVGRVSTFLSVAPAAIRRFEREIAAGLVQPRDEASLTSALASLLVASPDVSEVTLTMARRTGYGADGEIELAPQSGAQWSFVRGNPEVAKPGARIRLTHVSAEDGKFVARRRNYPAADPSDAAGQAEQVPDPTEHLTFRTPASRDQLGNLLWSDLHWSEVDAEMPAEKRRVEVSVQQSLQDPGGEFLGVLRVGLLTRELDRAVQVRLAPPDAPDPHRIFICDTEGRLITRLAEGDLVQAVGDDLRVMPVRPPGEIVAALAEPGLRRIGPDFPSCFGSLLHDGEEFLVSFRTLPETQDWVVGIVVPRAHYLGQAIALRNRLLLVLLGIMGVLLLGGGWIQRGVTRAQGQIARETERMNAFEFAPAPATSAFRDVGAVLESLERAKAAMRAMSKYVPIDLVRRLYREKSEPVLGGEETELSIMFTDIKGFTSLAETLEPNVLADALGRYLSVMVRIIQTEHRGTIDKFIGDAVMAIWNAPEPVPCHARQACLAALECQREAQALAQLPEWKGLPVFETRFGLHRDVALVGHFGAPDRLNYTAIGDAVNLASRLEALNKQYQTSIIVSESIRAEVRDEFAFRLLDRVAVKGKLQPITIYELLGIAGANVDRAAVSDYERAFALHLERNCEAAIPLLQRHPDDGPSRNLLDRCRQYLESPPPSDWDGVFVALLK